VERFDEKEDPHGAYHRSSPVSFRNRLAFWASIFGATG
jgi:hypothetical protein